MISLMPSHNIRYNTSYSASIPILNRIPIRDKQTGTFYIGSSLKNRVFYSQYLAKILLKFEQFGLPKQKKQL